MISFLTLKNFCAPAKPEARGVRRSQLWQVNGTMTLGPSALSRIIWLTGATWLSCKLYTYHTCTRGSASKDEIWSYNVHTIECRYVVQYTEQWLLNIAGCPQEASNSDTLPFMFYPCLSVLDFKQAKASSLLHGNSSLWRLEFPASLGVRTLAAGALWPTAFLIQVLQDKDA